MYLGDTSYHDTASFIFFTKFAFITFVFVLAVKFKRP